MVYLNKFFFFGLIFIVLLLHNEIIFADSVDLKNGEFEDKGTAWTINSSQVQTVYLSTDPHSGSTSAQLTNNSASSYGLEQTVTNVLPNTTYKLSGYIKTNMTPVSKILLRIAWYSTADGTGSQIKIDDSPSMTSTSGLWQPLDISAKSPSNALSSKVRLLVASGTASFDSIQFNEYTDIASTPTAFPTSMITPSLEPTVTITSTPNLLINNIYLSEVMSYPASGSHEWVELYNANDFDITLTDWYLDDGEDQGAAPYLFSVTIPANDYASIELETSLYNNAGDQVRLLDQNKELKDHLTYTNSKKGYSWGKTDFLFSSICLQNPSLDEQNNDCLIVENKQVLGASVKPTPTPRSLGKDITTTKLAEIKSVNEPETHYKRYAIQPEINQKKELPQHEDIYIPLHGSRHTQNPAVNLLAVSYSLLSFSSILMKLYRDSATL